MLFHFHVVVSEIEFSIGVVLDVVETHQLDIGFEEEEKRQDVAFDKDRSL